MERGMEDISLHEDILFDNVDILNITSQVEYTHIKFIAEVDMNLIIILGMCFSNAKEFREIVRNYAIKNGR